MNVATERKLSRLRGNLARQQAAILETEDEIRKVKETPEYISKPNSNKYLGVLTKLHTKVNRQRENRDDTLAMIEAFEYEATDPAQLDVLPEHVEANERAHKRATRGSVTQHS